MSYTPYFALLLVLTGCDVTEPYLHSGSWRPGNATDLNIAAQIYRPSDLVRGVEYSPTDSSMQTAAVERYRAGRIKPLPQTVISRIGASSGAADPAAPAAPTGGTAAAGP